jgi:hypothetical protein
MKTKRYDGEDGSEVIDDLEQANKGENLDTTPGPVAKRTPMVTKEQLAASGLSLRDYLNKQQGLTRRGGSEKSTRMPARPGQEDSVSSNEGRNNPRVSKPGMYSKTIKDIKGIFKGPRRGGDSGKMASRMGVNPNTLLPSRMASGGSVGSASKRADGIAQRGKTKGKMC